MKNGVHKLGETHISICDKPDKAYKKLASLIQVLNASDYECLVSAQTLGDEVFICVEYCYEKSKADDYGSDRFMIVSCEEEEEIIELRQLKLEQEKNRADVGE